MKYLKKIVFLSGFVLSLQLGYSQCPPVLDQSHVSSWAANTDTDRWQSFTAGISGDLSRIVLFGNGATNTTFTLSIYAGTGTAGTLLYSGPYTFNEVGLQPPLVCNIPCNQMPVVVTGSVYTIRVQGTFNTGYNGTNPYPGGSYWTLAGGAQPSADMNFQTFVSDSNLPDVNLVPTQPSCAGVNDGSIISTVAGGTGPYSYLWSPGPQVTPNLTGQGPGIYSVIVTDAALCTSCPDTAILVAPPPITVNAGSDLTVCEGVPTVSLSGSVTVATGGSWSSSGTGSFGSMTSLNTTYTPSAADILAGTVTLTLTTTGNGSCSPQSDFLIITINPSPTVNAGADQTVCEGTSVTLSASGTAVSYVWDNGVIDNSPFVPGVGLVTYTLTGTDVNGCINSDLVTITVNAEPNVVFGPVSPLCMSGSTYTFVEGSPAGGAYSGPGVSAGTITPSLAGLGIHTIYYTYTDGNGCTSMDSSDIVIYSSPTVVANASATNLCDGEILILNGSGALSYSWNNGVSDGVSFTPVAGTYVYTVNGIDANNCSNSDSVTVTVHPLPTVNAGPDMTVCEGNPVTLSGSGAVSYLWDNGISNGSPFSPAVGSLTYTVTGTDSNSCQGSDVVIVTVHPNPVLTVSPDQVFCLGDQITLTAAGADTYNWDGGSGNQPTYQIQPTGSVTVPVTGFSTQGCTSVASINLTLDDPNNVDAGADQTVCSGFMANLSATGGIDYLWNGPGVHNENNQSISFTVDTSAYFNVTVTTSQGCVYSDSVLITMSTDPSCTIGIISSITPNGDGVNDSWRINGIESFPDNTVTIFNRWGDVVFQEDGYDNDVVFWDGTSNGNILGAGTYFYVIEIVNGPSESGWIQLMK